MNANNKTNNCRCLRLVKDTLILTGKIILALLAALYRSIVPRSKKSLKDEIVLVTGAGRGLGKELALKFASLQAVLVLWDIDEKNCQNVASQIRALGGIAHAYKCDVTNAADVERAGRLVKEQVGDVMVLVNNAGILQNVSFTDLDRNIIKKTLEVNVLAHFWTIKFFLPQMIEKKKGHILAVSSLAGLVGWIYMVDYCASKFAIVGMMESLEEELRIKGLGDSIHFTTVCPITIDTGLNHSPTTRFPRLVPILKTEDAAEDIVQAVQRNERLVTIPRRAMFLALMQRLLPRKITQLVLDFLEYNMNPNNNNHS